MKKGILSAILMGGAVALSVTDADGQSSNTSSRTTPANSINQQPVKTPMAAKAPSVSATATRTPEPRETGSTISTPKPAPRLALTPVAPDDLSEGTLRVLNLFDSHTPKEKILFYAKNTPRSFDLSVADVNYLEDIGVPTDVVVAMIQNPGARQTYLARSGRSSVGPASELSPSIANNGAAPTSNAPKPGQPIVEAAGSSATTSNQEDTSVPKYYDSTDNTRPDPSAPIYNYPYNLRAPVNGNGYNNYNGYNGYNIYNGNNGYNTGQNNGSATRYYEHFDNPRIYAP